MDVVFLKCIKENNKLRIKIISPGYNNLANSQFPKNLRTEGRLFSVPSSDISFAEGPKHKFFYRIKAKNIKIITANEVTVQSLPSLTTTTTSFTTTTSTTVKPEKIYESEGTECVICFERDRDIIFSPCGHYVSCCPCATGIQEHGNKCPVCREKILVLVTKDQI